MAGYYPLRDISPILESNTQKPRGVFSRALQAEDKPRFNLNGCSQLSSETAGQRSFVSDNAAAGSPNRLKNGFPVPRKDRDDVDDFARDAELLLGELSNFAQNVDLGSPADQSDVITCRKKRAGS